jgi:hypothetical protein
MDDQDGEIDEVQLYYDNHSYLSGRGATIPLVAAVMEAIARLTFAAPWRDRRLDGLVIETDLPGARQLVFRMKESTPGYPSWELLPSLRAYEALLRDPDEDLHVFEPRRLECHYCTPMKLGATERRELAQHRFVVYGSRVPSLHVLVEGLSRAAPSADDLVALGVTALALSHARDAMTSAVWCDAPAIECSIQVQWLGEPRIVRIRGPLWRALDQGLVGASALYVPEPAPALRAYDPDDAAGMSTIPDHDERVIVAPERERNAGPGDRERIAAFAQWLHERGVASPGDPLRALRWLVAMLRFDAGPLVEDVGGACLELYLFDRMPTAALLDADDAPMLVEGLRLYYQWRAMLGDPRGPSCLAVLDDAASELLASNLADHRRHSFAKRRALGELAIAHDRPHASA